MAEDIKMDPNTDLPLNLMLNKKETRGAVKLESQKAKQRK